MAQVGPRLDDKLGCDVAIIGGGLTGLSSALHLAEAGKDVVLLEAKQVGWGASGRAFGQIVPAAKHQDSHVLKTFGATRGQAIIDLLSGGPRLVFDLIDRHGILCDDTRSGMILAAHSRKAAKVLRSRRDALVAKGADVAFLQGSAAYELIGSDYYPACFLDRRAGSLNPNAFVRGLAEVAARSGVAVFCNSPVHRLSKCGEEWEVGTREGSVVARSVVLAVNAYLGTPFSDLWPDLARSFIPMRTYQLISEPVGHNVAASILPKRQSMIDTRHLFSGIRRTGDGRLHVSGDGPAFDPAGRSDPDLAAKRIMATFPQVKSLDWAETWPGWVAVTQDQYPRLHHLAAGVWCAFGYSGRGIAFGLLLGREIARHILGNRQDPPVYPVTPLKPIFAHAFSPDYVTALMAYYRRRDRMATAGYLGRTS